MILKAIIKKLPEDSNYYTVRIPFFEDHTKDEIEFEALLAYTPGITNTYNINDRVFVSFENNKYDRPIILGKLYTVTESDEISGTSQNTMAGDANLNSLKVEGISLTGDTLNRINNLDILQYIVLEEW